MPSDILPTVLGSAAGLLTGFGSAYMAFLHNLRREIKAAIHASLTDFRLSLQDPEKGFLPRSEAAAMRVDTASGMSRDIRAALVEFRIALQDQTDGFVPRGEAKILHDELVRRIALMESNLTQLPCRAIWSDRGVSEARS